MMAINVMIIIVCTTIILQHKRLFTGAGARFFCTRGGYESDYIRKTKYSPPCLDGTPWEHIFIQSHSNERELQADSKFLYFEYQTHK